MTTILAALLAVVSISPSFLNLQSWGGMCSGKMRVYVPSHPDNRRIVIQQSDGTTADVDVSEADIAASGFSRDIIIVAYEGDHRTITAWVYGPGRDTIRGTAVARVNCN